MSKYMVFDIETTGLNWHTGNVITCVCALTDDGKEFKECGEDEKMIIEDFFEFLKENKEAILISANGKGFDAPFIIGRGYFNGIYLTKSMDFLSRGHFDIINDITDRRISLNNLAKLYGVSLKNGNGLRAIELFKENKYEELLSYCMEDVKITQEVYTKYLELKK